MNDEQVLIHHGILGQKWGVRRYQNEDGTLTEEGKKHYNSNYRSDSYTHGSVEFGKYLQKKGYVPKNSTYEFSKNLETDRYDLKFNKNTVNKDYFIRDNILGLGKILEENNSEHYYITTVKVKPNVQTLAMIQRKGNKAFISVYAKEGLIKQGLHDKTFKMLRDRLT